MAKFTGTSADDVVVGSLSPDTIDGGAGNDTLYGYGDGKGVGGTPPVGDPPVAPDDKDSLLGGTGDDQIFAGDGADTLDGGLGADTADGGAGDDRYRVDRTDDQAIEALAGPDGGTDTVESKAVAYELGANIENLTLIGAALAGTGNNLDNRIVGNAAANTLAGAAGEDTVDGGGGNDVIEGGSGEDFLVGGAGDDHLTGGSELDQLQGGAGNDTLHGGDGEDFLNGDAGADVLIGQEGDDHYFLDAAGDVIVETGTTLNDNVASTMAVDLTSAKFAGIEDAALSGTAGVNLIGDENANALFGNAGANRIEGGGNNDRLSGEAGNDTLIGGDGFDDYDGGLGNDLFIIDAADGAFSINEGLGEGTDTVQTPHSYTLVSNIENLVLTGGGLGIGNELANRITNLDKATDSLLQGLDGNDTLTGSDGDDEFYGGAGADSMVGGEGADVYRVDNAGDKIGETGKVTAPDDGDNFDWVETTLAAYTLGANLENLQLISAGPATGIGNTLGNFIEGTDFNDTLRGLAGNDRLEGEGGADSLDGGVGDDTLRGGDGVDSLKGGAGNDRYDLDGSDIIVELANQGLDQVFSGVQTHALADNVENLTLTGAAVSGTGNALANVLTGNTGANSLSGSFGNDTLDGGGADDKIDALDGGDGNDTYVLFSGGGADSIVDAGGIDTVVSNATFTLVNINLENLTLIGAAAVNGTGNASANRLIGNDGANTLTGGLGNDTIEGGAGKDRLIGNEDNDVLLGGAETDVLVGDAGNDSMVGGDGDDSHNIGTGLDTMVGGFGDDRYGVDNAGDKVVELANQGRDLVTSFIDYVLPTQVEDLVLGDIAVLGTGNTLDNNIVGNSVANKLSGLAGNDTLIGGTGNDTLIGGTGNDRYLLSAAAGDSIVELANQGIDTVVASLAFVLGDHLENLTLEGLSAIAGTGNALNNAMTGNAGANTLTGGLGNDTLDGGELDGKGDTLDGGAGNDSYFMYGGGGGPDSIVDASGIDTVFADADFVIGGGVAILENLTLLGAAVSGIGNDIANRLLGNASGNQLEGREGNDTLEGGDGNDSLLGGIDNDSLVGGANADSLDGGTGNDSMAGGAGDDIYDVDGILDKVTEAAGSGIDTVVARITLTLAANVENLTLATGFGNIGGTGNTLDNLIAGNSNANTLSGLGGNDTLDGGAGVNSDGAVDTLAGGAGNDLYLVDFSDLVVEAANAGIDAVQTAFSHELAANIENLVLAGSAIAGTGNALNNAISGNAVANELTGGLGNDTLDGGGADGKNDTLDGGDGNDSYVVWAGTADIIQDSGGIDTVISHAATHTLAAGLENLTLMAAAVTGIGNSGANRILGNDGANTLVGDKGNDTLEGGADGDFLDGGDGNDSLLGGAGNDLLLDNAGADTMVGGLGDDRYLIYNSSQKAVESKGQGLDTVLLVGGSNVIANYVLPTEIEFLDATESTSDLIATGNALANKMTGNDENNRIDGGLGNDTLVGNAGNDTLIGGTGADSMEGGLGDDVYFIDNVGDTVFDSGGFNDEIRSSVALAAVISGIEHYSFTGAAVYFTGDGEANRIAGGAAADTLRGGEGDDTLNGGAGADVLISEQGNDTYVIDNAGDKVIDLGDGTDTVLATVAVDLTLAKFDGIERATLLGSAGLALTGDEFDNILIGNTGANKIVGGGGYDQLHGNAGNDTLDGGAVGDDLFGGEGNDSIVGGEGDDFMTGDAGSDTLAGGAGNDVLEGVAGNDALDGGAGDDRLGGGEGNDRILGGEGNDTISGDAGNDSILGGGGDDFILGRAGADTIAGGDGKDSYVYAGNDVLQPGDVIQGFADSGASQDLVDLSEPFFILGVAVAARAARVSLVDTGANVDLLIDTDGNGTFDWKVLTFQGLADPSGLSVGTAPTDDIQVGTL